MRADFLNLPPEPFPADRLPAFDLDGPERFFNRELSWLAFNWRVLEEAENADHPLLERVRFLSISGNNLDEFYTVRVAGLRTLAHNGVTNPSADGRTPAEQLALIDAEARRLMARQDAVWRDLQSELEAEGIILASLDELGIFYPEDLEAKAEIKNGDILFIHTGWHKYSFHSPTGDECASAGSRGRGTRSTRGGCRESE